MNFDVLSLKLKIHSSMKKCGFQFGFVMVVMPIGRGKAAGGGKEKKSHEITTSTCVFCGKLCLIGAGRKLGDGFGSRALIRGAAVVLRVRPHRLREQVWLQIFAASFKMKLLKSSEISKYRMQPKYQNMPGFIF